MPNKTKVVSPSTHRANPTHRPPLPLASNHLGVGAFLFILALCIAPFANAGRQVVLHDGTIINVPPWGSTCEYQETYCPAGWLPDGTFPINKQLQDLAQQCNLPYNPPENFTVILCETQGLKLSPNFEPGYCADEDGNPLVFD